jgi:hypothetical protein
VYKLTKIHRLRDVDYLPLGAVFGENFDDAMKSVSAGELMVTAPACRSCLAYGAWPFAHHRDR